MTRPKQHTNRIKNLFKSIKRRPKQNYYSEKLLRFTHSFKKMWEVTAHKTGQETDDLFTFTGEILNGKLHCLYSE